MFSVAGIVSAFRIVSTAKRQNTRNPSCSLPRILSRFPRPLRDARRAREAERHDPKERVTAPAPRVTVSLVEHRLHALAIEYLPQVIARRIEADLTDERQ